MKSLKKILVFILLLSLVTSAFVSCKKDKDEDENGKPRAWWLPTLKELNVSSDSLYVNKVNNLSDDFIFGMDASAVPSLEAGGVK